MITIITAIIATILGFISAYIIFKLKQRDSFITGILESRINAAQEAYSQSLTISQNIHEDDGIKTRLIKDFEEWFRNNSLRLPKEIRDILRDGVHYIGYYNLLKEDYKFERLEGDKEKADEKYAEMYKNFKFIRAMPRTIEHISDNLFNRYMESGQLGIIGFFKNIFK